MTQALVYDIGGTHLRAGVLDASGAVRQIAKRRLRSVATNHTGDEVWSSLLSAVLEYEHAHRDLLPESSPIIIAFPGPVDVHRNILQAPTLVGSADVPDIAHTLELRTGRRVFILNDLSAAAWHFADRCDSTRFMVVTISSGIGSKIFDRRHANGVLDDPVHSGEIGHFVVDDRTDAPICDCGGRGHLGAIGSGRGFERAARQLAAEDSAGFRSSMVFKAVGSHAERVTNEEHLVPAALAGDAWTLDILHRCSRPVARTLVAVLMAAGLEHIFVIGGFAQALGDVYLTILRAEMLAVSRYPLIRDTLASRIELGAVGDEACLHGCGVFAQTVASGELVSRT